MVSPIRQVSSLILKQQYLAAAQSDLILPLSLRNKVPGCIRSRIAKVSLIGTT